MKFKQITSWIHWASILFLWQWPVAYAWPCQELVGMRYTNAFHNYSVTLLEDFTGHFCKVSPMHALLDNSIQTMHIWAAKECHCLIAVKVYALSTSSEQLPSSTTFKHSTAWLHWPYLDIMHIRVKIWLILCIQVQKFNATSIGIRDMCKYKEG